MAAERILDSVAVAVDAGGPYSAISVGFSGGVDSSVLLHALARLSRARTLAPLRALHVDHGLCQDAPRWSRECAERCRALGVEFEAMRVDASPGRGESPEQAARRARYAALRERLRPGEALCLGHHADDQAETVLLQLLRGSGPSGLKAMAPERALAPGWLLRPLLERRRREIEACAREWGLSWIEDPGNADLRHPRNRLREQVLPLLESVAPGATRAMVRAARLQAEAEGAVRELARRDLVQCAESSPARLSRDALRALPSSRRRAALRLWLEGLGLPLPGEARLREAERQLVEARADRRPRVAWSGGELRIESGRVFAFARAPLAPQSAPGWRWEPGAALELPTGTLCAEPVSGAGLRCAGVLDVRYRQGGERCRPAGRRHSQSLKRLLQEYRVPAWQRAQLPLLYHEGALVAVADLWVCHGHVAAAGETGWRLRWVQSDREPVESGAHAAPGGEPCPARRVYSS